MVKKNQNFPRKVHLPKTLDSYPQNMIISLILPEMIENCHQNLIVVNCSDTKAARAFWAITRNIYIEEVTFVDRFLGPDSKH